MFICTTYFLNDTIKHITAKKIYLLTLINKALQKIYMYVCICKAKKAENNKHVKMQNGH